MAVGFGDGGLEGARVVKPRPGKELQKFFERVLNEDLRAFLELIQRVQVRKLRGSQGNPGWEPRVGSQGGKPWEVRGTVEQVLEVERLELDHFWEIHRQQLEQRDQAHLGVSPCLDKHLGYKLYINYIYLK